jgi:hypothetical protein
MVKCPICRKMLIQKIESKQVKRGMYDAQPMNLYPNPYDNIEKPVEYEITYHCIDPKCFGVLSLEEYNFEKEYEQFMKKPAKLPYVESDFFISYYSGTGATFAKYLKKHSKDIGNLTSFLDKEDIPKNIDEDSENFHLHIDKGIENSKNFVLIMTLRFNERPEVIREFVKARDLKIPIFLFKQDILNTENLYSFYEGDPIDFSAMQYSEFKDECDLLTKVDEAINTKHKNKKIPYKTRRLNLSKYDDSHKRMTKEQEIAYLSAIRDFKNAFHAVQEVSEASTKLKMLFDFQDQLNQLCQRYKWNQMKEEIGKVLMCIIPDKLTNDSLGKKYVQILAIILDCYKETVVNIISTKWGKELEKLFNDPDYRTDDVAVLFVMLQQLNRYSEDYLEKIVDDAAIKWSKLKFSLLAYNIGFAKLRDSDYTAYARMLSYIRRKMEQSVKDNKEEESRRLEIIYDIAKK